MKVGRSAGLNGQNLQEIFLARKVKIEPWQGRLDAERSGGFDGTM
jgi:hypothetical protein